MVAHGMAQFLKERMMETADFYTTYVCDICGLLAQKVIDKNFYVCKSCKNYNKISKVNMPYAFKLTIQELMSVNIAPRIITNKSINKN